MSIHHDMPFADYLAVDALSNSGIQRFRRSPAHYQAYLSQPHRDTPALRFGRIIHTATLEPDKCKLAVAPDVDRRTKDGKATWAAFQADNQDADIVTAEEMAAVAGIQESITAHPAAHALLAHPGHAEASFFWTDPASGVQLKGRADYLRTDGIIVDLKTTDDASPDNFARSVAKYGYHYQAALYEQGLTACGIDVTGFIFVAGEKSPPFAVACYMLDAESVGSAQADLPGVLRRFADCQQSGLWPAYSTRIETLTLPRWAMNQETEI